MKKHTHHPTLWIYGSDIFKSNSNLNSREWKDVVYFWESDIRYTSKDKLYEGASFLKKYIPKESKGLYSYRCAIKAGDSSYTLMDVIVNEIFPYVEGENLNEIKKSGSWLYLEGNNTIVYELSSDPFSIAYIKALEAVDHYNRYLETPEYISEEIEMFEEYFHNLEDIVPQTYEEILENHLNEIYKNFVSYELVVIGANKSLIEVLSNEIRDTVSFVLMNEARLFEEHEQNSLDLNIYYDDDDGLVYVDF